MKPLFLLDGDGVMLDYNMAFKEVYEKIYNVELQLVKPTSYLAVEMWGVGDMSKEQYAHFKEESAKLGMWENMPAMPDSLEFVQEISKYFTVWCLTSMPTCFEEDRLKNLQKLGFPIEKVIATSRIGKENPKKKFIEELNPMYFMDDLLQNFEDVEVKNTQLIFLDWKHEDSPNKKYPHVEPHLTINHYNDFFALSAYYFQQRKELKLGLEHDGTGFFNHLGQVIPVNFVPISYRLKDEMRRIQLRFSNYALENDFTEKDNNDFESVISLIKEELPNWLVHKK